MNPIVLFVILISYDHLDETARNIRICNSIKGINNFLGYLKASARTNSMIATNIIE